MIASTIIVVASLPIYRSLFHLYDVTGLVIASDIGILMHTVVLAWLLHHKKMVLLSGIAVAGADEVAGDRNCCRVCVLRGWPNDDCACQPHR